MTRINLVPVCELADQHLVAEYREIFMVGSSLQRSMRSPNWPTKKSALPKYLDLIEEMKCRGMNPDPSRKFKREQWPDELFSNWAPNENDLAVIRERIETKIQQKPGWYRWTQKKQGGNG